MKLSARAQAGLFFLAGVLLRIPFRSQYLYHWDSVNFALGLEQFDILRHQPQPPGYVLYILLGRLFQMIFVDGNASLVWISVLFSGLAAAALYWTARHLFGQRVGLAAGLLGLTSPLVWFYSEVALSYTVEAFFVSAVAYCCYRTLRGPKGDGRYALAGAALLGMAGGFRQNTLVLLLPVWLFSLRKLNWGRRIAALALLGGIVAAWLAVMMSMNGGPARYLAGLSAQTGSNISDSAAGSAQTLLMNFARLGLFTGFGVMLAGLALPVWAVWLARNLRAMLRSEAWQVLLLWVLPSLVFYAIYIQQGGHTFTYLPGLIIICAWTLLEVIAPYATRRGLGARLAGGLVVGIVAVNAVFFLFSRPYLLGIEKFLLRTPSYAAIRERDEKLGQKLAFIRAQFPPEETLVLAGGMDFRIPDYYLRDYRYTFLSYDSTALSEAGGPATDGLRYLVMFNDEGPYPGIALDGMQQFWPADALYWTELGEDARLVFSPTGVALVRRK